MKDYYLLNKDFKNDLGLHQYAPLTTNALQIDIKSGSWNGKVEAIRTGDVSKVQNFFIKSGTVVALKRQYIISQGHAYVDIDMIYPFPNSKWRNIYNGSWTGWKLVFGDVDMNSNLLNKSKII